MCEFSENLQFSSSSSHYSRWLILLLLFYFWVHFPVAPKFWLPVCKRIKMFFSQHFPTTSHPPAPPRLQPLPPAPPTCQRCALAFVYLFIERQFCNEFITMPMLQGLCIKQQQHQNKNKKKTNKSMPQRCLNTLHLSAVWHISLLGCPLIYKLYCRSGFSIYINSILSLSDA